MGSKFFRYLFRAMAVTSLITQTLPRLMEDGKITVIECANFVQEVCTIFGWKAHIEVPDNMVEETFNITVE